MMTIVRLLIVVTFIFVFPLSPQPLLISLGKQNPLVVPSSFRSLLPTLPHTPTYSPTYSVPLQYCLARSSITSTVTLYNLFNSTFTPHHTILLIMKYAALTVVLFAGISVALDLSLLSGLPQCGVCKLRILASAGQ